METNNIDLIKNLTETANEVTDIKEEKPLINDVNMKSSIDENNKDVKNDASAVTLTSTLPPVQVKKRKRKINPNKIKRRRRYIEGQPKAPLTGYVRFMSEKREQLKIEFPNKTAIEHTKIIAEYWNRMTDEEKNPYLKAADLERVKYQEELEEFKKQKSLVVPTEEGSGKDSGQENRNPQNGQQKQQMNGGVVSGPKKLAKDIVTNGNNNKKRRIGDDGKGIPIFTDEFLEHNKNIDAELRVLRKSNGDYEQQNSVLEKHIENMKFGLEKLENENQELEEKNRLFQAYLEKLKTKLITALSGLELDELNGASFDNIDKYLNELLGNANSHNLNKAKDIMRKLDLHIQL